MGEVSKEKVVGSKGFHTKSEFKKEKEKRNEQRKVRLQKIKERNKRDRGFKNGKDK